MKICCCDRSGVFDSFLIDGPIIKNHRARTIAPLRRGSLQRTMMMTMRPFAAVVASLLFATQCAAFAPHLPQTQSRRAVSIASTTTIAPSSGSSTSLQVQVLERTELPEKLYFPKEKETPKVLGGLKVGLRKLVCITGASSGLGLATAITLAKTGKYFVVMACRNIEKAKEGTSLLSVYY
jgi:hypothetical protein